VCVLSVVGLVQVLDLSLMVALSPSAVPLIGMYLLLSWVVAMVRVEFLVCGRCGAPVSVLYDGLCVRCVESVEPPLLRWRALLRSLISP